MKKIWLFIASCMLFSSMVQASDQSYTVKHRLGEATFNSPPTRIVSLFQGANDTLVAFGIKPVGIVESWVEKPVYPYLREELGDVTNVGLETQPSLETIKSLNPDLIIASRYRNENIFPLLNDIAPTIAFEQVFFFKETVTKLGEVLQRQEQAQRLLQDYEDNAKSLAEELAQKYGDKWPMTVSLVGFRPDHVRYYGPKSFPGRVLQDIGFKWTEYGHNVPGWGGKGWGTVFKTQEALIDANADIFFVWRRDQDQAAVQNHEQWVSSPLWQRLDAVKNNHVYKVDNISWSISSGILSANIIIEQIREHMLENTVK